MENTHIFDHIENDMPVIQPSDNEEIGKVEFVRYGEGDSVADLPEIDTIVEALANALTGNSNYPDEVYQRLYAEGYIQIERGLEPDAFAFPSQIECVSDGKVYLTVNQDNLLKE